jgi:hypothetical protein
MFVIINYYGYKTLHLALRAFGAKEGSVLGLEKIQHLTSRDTVRRSITWDPGYLVGLRVPRRCGAPLHPSMALGLVGLGPVSCTGDR